MSMKIPYLSSRFAVALAAGLAASSAPAAITISASATLSDVLVGSTYDYTLTLYNTGTVPIEGFWYGWTTSGNNLPSSPSSAGNSLGWQNNVFGGTSIKYQGASGDSLATSSSATFTFDSTSTPSQITASPAGESVVYTGTIDTTENSAGDSSAVFAPALVPEPSPLVLFAGGLLAVSAAGWRRGRGLFARRPHR
jgi:hypothetical protein